MALNPKQSGVVSSVCIVLHRPLPFPSWCFPGTRKRPIILSLSCCARKVKGPPRMKREKVVSPRRRSGKTKKAGSGKESAVERRVSTPRSDLVVVTIGRPSAKPLVPAKEQASKLIADLAKAIGKRGTSRDPIFRSKIGKPVFACSIYPKDTSKIVREDANGNKTVGRLVNGRFRPSNATQQS